MNANSENSINNSASCSAELMDQIGFKYIDE